MKSLKTSKQEDNNWNLLKTKVIGMSRQPFPDYYRPADMRRCYGIGLNVLKTKVIRMSRHPFLVKIMIHQKQLENMEYLNYMGSLIKQVM